MVELREQLGALLRLEVKYATRDYLLDLTSQDEYCDASTTATSLQIGNCVDFGNSTTSQDQVVLSGEKSSPPSSTATTEVAEEELKNSDTMSSSTTSSISRNTAITEEHAVSWREKICEWSYQVADHFDLSRDLVYIALNYVDRVCAASNTVELLRDKNRFQLLAMAALCLAIKLHGGMDTHVPGTEASIVETILHLGRGHFTAEQLKAMEIDALQRLQWLLNPPTPQDFVSYLLVLFPMEGKTEINDIALYVIELSVHDYYLISSKPSVLALAAISNAARMLGHSDAWMVDIQEDLLRHDGYEETVNIDACKNRLGRLYANTGTKLEDFTDISALNNSNNLNEICREQSPTSVLY